MYMLIWFQNPNEFGMQLTPIKNSLTQLTGEENTKAISVFKIVSSLFSKLAKTKFIPYSRSLSTTIETAGS